jgi:steroid delta-isomerase-like uncharacterized protein
MSAQENVALVRRFFEEFCNGRRDELAEELFTADHVYRDPQVPNVAGPRAMVEAVAVYQNGLNGHWGIEEILPAGDDRVVTRWTGTGVHQSDLMGIPATGKAIRVDAISVQRIAGGKIAEHWCVWDTLGLLQQIGAVPVPG